VELEDCYEKALIKKTKENKNLAQSLIEMADIKEETVRDSKIDERNISAYVSLAYDALRETLEALCVLKGYKVLSHLCLGEMLKNWFSDFDYEEFDRLRYARNSINCYGVKIDFEQGKKLIEKIFRMRKTIIKKYLDVVN